VPSYEEEMAREREQQKNEATGEEKKGYEVSKPAKEGTEGQISLH